MPELQIWHIPFKIYPSLIHSSSVFSSEFFWYSKVFICSPVGTRWLAVGGSFSSQNMMKSKHTNPAKNNNPSKAKINPSVNPMLTFSSWQASLSMHKLKFGYVNGVFGPKVLPQQVPRQLFKFNVVEVLIRQFPFESEEVHWLKVQFLRVFYATHLSQHIVQFILYVCMQSSQLAPNLSSPETKPTSVKIKNGVSIVCFLQQAYNASFKIKKFLLLKTWPANLTSQSSISSDHIAYTFVAFVSLIDVKVNYA